MNEARTLWPEHTFGFGKIPAKKTFSHAESPPSIFGPHQVAKQHDSGENVMRATAEMPGTLAVGGVRRVPGVIWLLLLIVAPLPIFWFGFVGLSIAWAEPEFRFKALVPFLCLLMFLQVMRSVSPAGGTSEARWPGVLLVGCALLLALVGNMVHVNYPVFLAMILYAAGAIVTVFGLRRAFAFWAPVASLALMLPIPRFLYAEIHAFLERLACTLAVTALRPLGVAVHVEGQVIDFGSVALRLSVATSGLINFLPLMLVFFFLATFHRAPLWRRLMPLVLAAPMLVLLSAARLVGFGIVLDRSGVPDAERFLTVTDGWSFFLAAAVLLLLVTMLTSRLAEPGRSITSRIDIKPGELVSQFRRFSSIERSGALAAAAVLALATSAAFHFAPAWASAPIEREPFSRFSPELAGWSGSGMAIEDRTQVSLKADDYILMDFFHPDEDAPVNFWVAYYYSQGREQGAIHSPQVCLPADGWNIVSINKTDVSVAPSGENITLNRAVIRRDGSTALVYYWFEGRGSRDANEVVARLRMRMDGVIKARTDGALVRFVTPILPDEKESEADARLQRLLTAAVSQLPRFVPE